MADRAALVTGGSSGIGLAIARALGEDGYGVTVAARRPDKLEAAADELRSAGIDVHAVAAQMTEEEDVVRAVDEHRERWGRMDVLVNNAGVGLGGAIEGYPTKKIDMQLDLNLQGDRDLDAREPGDASRGGWRAWEGADRQYGFGRREGGPGVALHLFGDEGGSDRLLAGDSESSLGMRGFR